MAERTSLFQLLSRQPWWVSALATVVIFAIAQVVFPPLAPFVALPFVIVTLYIAWQQTRGAAVVDVEGKLAALRGMPWENFSLVISEAYRRQGYAVQPSDQPGYDFRVSKQGRNMLVQCRRWKVNQVGVAAVRELNAALEREEAYKGICIATGNFSAAAREFIAGTAVTLLNGRELVELAGTLEKSRWRWFGR